MVRINFQFKGLHYHILFMAAKLANKSDLLEPFCTYHITVFENIPKRSPSLLKPVLKIQIPNFWSDIFVQMRLFR